MRHLPKNTRELQTPMLVNFYMRRRGPRDERFGATPARIGVGCVAGHPTLEAELHRHLQDARVERARDLPERRSTVCQAQARRAGR